MGAGLGTSLDGLGRRLTSGELLSVGGGGESASRGNCQ